MTFPSNPAKRYAKEVALLGGLLGTSDKRGYQGGRVIGNGDADRLETSRVLVSAAICGPPRDQLSSADGLGSPSDCGTCDPLHRWCGAHFRSRCTAMACTRRPRSDSEPMLVQPRRTPDAWRLLFGDDGEPLTTSDAAVKRLYCQIPKFAAYFLRLISQRLFQIIATRGKARNAGLIYPGMESFQNGYAVRQLCV